jgi:hypothetical protein
VQIDPLIRSATENIDSPYFQLPIVDQEDPVYRERVYCYELYHQLRALWPANSKYTLSGEVDKSGHPLIRGDGLDQTKPDFLVHVPGNMGSNLLVMEVKPVNGTHEGVRKDLQTLTAFRRHGQYERAFYLIYGSDRAAFDDLRRVATRFAEQDCRQTIDLNLIELWYHSSARVTAEPAAWHA